MDNIMTEKIVENDKNQKKNNYKIKTCKVIKYDKKTKTLDVLFENCGLRFKGINSFNGDTVEVKYKGTCGKSDFEYFIK